MRQRVFGITLIEILRDEHKMIDEMMDMMDLSITKAKSPEGLPANVMKAELDFCKNFVNKCHEVKEEEILVPELQRHGYPLDRGPILEMIEDHKKGRAILRRLLAVERIGRDEDRQKSFSELGSAYALFLFEHMREEEDHLFKKADLAIELSRQQLLEADCRKLDDEKLGKSPKAVYESSMQQVRSVLG